MAPVMQYKISNIFDLAAIGQNPLDIASLYPQFRIMGSKHRLLPWLYDVFSSFKFETALDGFSGSGSIAYLFKAMGKTVVSNDYLQFPYHLANGLTANPGHRLSGEDIEYLIHVNENAGHFIETTFKGIFFSDEDLRFLDNVWSNLRTFIDPYKKSLVLSALTRSAVKKQPRGVFTVGNGQNQKYNDGRRDLRISMQKHFLESIDLLNTIVFDDARPHVANWGSIYDLAVSHPIDLAYFDPPYVPRSDDNDYIKRYHFIEGLSCYWEGQEIMADTKVRKIKKKFTPFAYRRTALDAFDQLFKKFADSIIVLSYSSNGYPDKDDLMEIMRRYKKKVTVEAKPHRYHFGTHKNVNPDRAVVQEYLIIGEG